MENKTTKAEEKLLVEFKKMIEVNDIQPQILKFRKKHGIPKDGLIPSEFDRKRLWDHICLPSGLSKKDSESDFECRSECDDLIRSILENFVLPTPYFRSALRSYIFYNDFFFEELMEQTPYFRRSNLCEVTDARYGLEVLLEHDNFFEIMSSEFNDGTEARIKKFPADQNLDEILAYAYVTSQRETLNKYPIAIRIHPDASQRVIVDFIKKNWSYITSLQDKYAEKNSASVKFGKTKRDERIAERNKFIYDHRHLPAKEISSLLNEKDYPDIDQGGILKIKSLEKKKREKK